MRIALIRTTITMSAERRTPMIVGVSMLCPYATILAGLTVRVSPSCPEEAFSSSTVGRFGSQYACKASLAESASMPPLIL
jgi:hypothetical protein